MKILNTWRSDDTKLTWMYPQKVVYENGDYRIFKMISSHLHTYKNIAFAELVGKNVSLIEGLIKGLPTDKNRHLHFRALDKIELGQLLLRVYDART